ncbi:MAG: hypothetical protein HY815_10355 [Candidatus Riflebacteria bacterium]|nr:hypothetical protein [Candidatus Riflebacteria bacterium]
MRHKSRFRNTPTDAPDPVVLNGTAMVRTRDVLNLPGWLSCFAFDWDWNTRSWQMVPGAQVSEDEQFFEIPSAGGTDRAGGAGGDPAIRHRRLCSWTRRW